VIDLWLTKDGSVSTSTRGTPEASAARVSLRSGRDVTGRDGTGRDGFRCSPLRGCAPQRLGRSLRLRAYARSGARTAFGARRFAAALLRGFGALCGWGAYGRSGARTAFGARRFAAALLRGFGALCGWAYGRSGGRDALRCSPLRGCAPQDLMCGSGLTCSSLYDAVRRWVAGYEPAGFAARSASFGDVGSVWFESRPFGLHCRASCDSAVLYSCGEGGIRTRGRVSPAPA
jgi:hypothetical protein